jgi:DnaJ family protein C protein 17
MGLSQIFSGSSSHADRISDPLDTTIRIRFPLKTYSQLKTPQAISTLLSRFGATDESSIVISTNLKGKKDKAPKMGSALVPFKQIGDAFAAVCASGKKDLGLDGIKLNWVRGEEPAILEWLRKMGKLNSGTGSSHLVAGGIRAELPQNQTRSSSDPFSSFPSTLVRLLSLSFCSFQLKSTFL